MEEQQRKVAAVTEGTVSSVNNTFVAKFDGVTFGIIEGAPFVSASFTTALGAKCWFKLNEHLCRNLVSRFVAIQERISELDSWGDLADDHRTVKELANMMRGGAWTQQVDVTGPADPIKINLKRTKKPGKGKKKK